MAAPRRKKSASTGKPAPKKGAAAPRRKSASGGPSVWLIFAGLVAACAILYFISGRHDSTSAASKDPLQEKVSKMAEENPDAEIFQMKEEPAQKVSEKKK